MTLKFTVIADNSGAYIGQKGQVKYQQLALLDTDPACPSINTFDYRLSEDEKDKYAGKLQGKVVTLGISNIKQFNGRVQFEGRLLEVAK